MQRLIDAKALEDFIENRYTITWESDTYVGGIKDACIDILEFMNTQPTIDAIPIEWIMRYAFDGGKQHPISITKMIADWRKENAETD